MGDDKRLQENNFSVRVGQSDKHSFPIPFDGFMNINYDIWHDRQII